MMLMFYIFLIIFLITNILMMICLILNKKSLYSREKLGPFECGFNQKSPSRNPFSLRFFLITIIFLIFDVEIALFLPSIPNFFFSSLMYWMIINFLFILILLIGLFHEWKQGALEWSF